MKSIKSLIGIGAFAFLLLGIPTIASAQYGGQYDPWGRNGQNDPYGRNGGYNNGQYGRYGRNGDMRSIVRDLKARSRELQRHLDEDLDRSRYNGTRREDQLNSMAREFRNAVNRLSESNNNNSGYGRRDDRIERVLSLGNQMRRQFTRAGLDYHVREMWNGIDYDLNILANSYGYNGRTNNGGWNNGGTWNNGQRPSWWPF